MPKVDINEIVDNLDMETYTEICDSITKIDRTNMDVLCQEGYRHLAFKVNELTLKYNMLRSLVQSLGQKKDLLVQLSANMRAEKNIYS